MIQDVFFFLLWEYHHLSLESFAANPCGPAQLPSSVRWNSHHGPRRRFLRLESIGNSMLGSGFMLVYHVATAHLTAEPMPNQLNLGPIFTESLSGLSIDGDPPQKRSSE